MIKKHHLRLLAALVVVCYLLTASPLSAIAQGTRPASAVPSSAESGNQAGEIPAAEEEGEEPGDEAPEEPAEQPGGEPDEEPGEEPEDPEEQSEGEPGDDAPGVEEEPGEDEPGTAEPESLPATTGLTVRHILVTLDGEFVVLDETVVEGLEIGTTVYGSDFVGSFGLHRFLCSAPEELVLGEEGNVIELFYEMLENPDGLEGPRELPAPELLIPDNGLKRTVGLSGLQDREDEPGSLSLNKVATPVEGMPNRWKITLTLSGINLETTSDVVLVIDTSGSMGQGSGRMAAAKQAAEKFVESLLSSPNTKVALVSFPDGVPAHLDGRFIGSDEKQELLNEINGLTANGGTFTQAAIRQARRLLEEASDADHKVIVLLSDGEPTYSYRIRTINDLETYVLAEWYWDWDGVLHRYWVTKDSLSESEFDYDTSGSGDGTSMTTYIGHVSNWYWVDLYYYHHGHSAVAESRFAKEDGITIYSIGLSRGSSGQRYWTG